MTREMRVGMEMEFWVVDERGELADSADIVDAHERVKPEFIPPLIEVQTEPHESEAALRRDLQEALRMAIEAATAAGKRLVPLGTPLTDSGSPTTTTERGRLFEAIYGDGIRSAKNCAGTHVHFEKGNVGRQLDLLTALDPALALVSSSPYYLGRRQQTSSRAFAYRHNCGAEFREFCSLWEYANSADEWQSRVDRAYERFQTIASERGVSKERVREHFVPDDTVLNPVRLRNSQPTVEWRAPDSALPSQTVRLAFDVARLVEATARKPVERGGVGVRSDRILIPDFPTLTEISEAAIDHGLDSARVREYLLEFGFDLSAYQPFAGRIAGPRTIPDTMARNVRLGRARRLHSDVERLAPTAENDDGPGERLAGMPSG